jgi:drug/metabolite transporter (DMT)-like permease
VRDRGILRARIFLGGVTLLAAVIAWGTAFMMSPHGDTVAPGTEHVRTTVAMFLRNSSVGTLVLCALAAWLLFPTRRPRAPLRDWTIIGLIGLMVLTSLYQLVWLGSVLH